MTLLNGMFNKNGIIDNKLNDNYIKINPNPITGIANIYFYNYIYQNYQIDVYNQTGQIICPIYDGMVEIGTNKYIWNSSNYPSGTYFCKITGKETNISYKIMVTK